MRDSTKLVLVPYQISVPDSRMNGHCKMYLEITTFPEVVVQSCSVKKVFLEISQNSQENTCVRVSFLIKLQASVGCF